MFPFTTDIIKCSKCKSYAFLNFIHEEIGDYYGPIHIKNMKVNIHIYVQKKENIL